MRTYIRKGLRTKMNPVKQKRLTECVNEIQGKIWEKSINIDKRLLPDFLKDDVSVTDNNLSNMSRK